MANKPAEKIEISLGKKDEKSEPAPLRTNHENRIEPLKVKSKKAETPNDPPEEKVEETAVLDDDISNRLQERPASSGLDGGFSSDMDEQTQDQDETVVSAPEDTADEVSIAPETEGDEKDANTDDDHAESDSEDSSEDTVYNEEHFYTSKLDPARTEEGKKDSHKKKAKSKGASRMSMQYLLVLATFVVVSLIGLAILYQLEEAKEGAGLIFDWLNIKL